MIVSQFAEQPAHTPFQAVSMFRAKGFTPVESLAIVEGQADQLSDSSLQRFMVMGVLSVADAAKFQRENVRTRDPLLASVEAAVTSTQRLEKAKADAERAKVRAAQPLSFFMDEERQILALDK
jgi:hypothetical protein